jgi:PIN domain nuclease of toxin-antitoxin system
LKLLLDTHTLFWSLEDPARISALALTAMQDPANELLLSAATVWELAIKVGQRKISLSIPYRRWMESALADLCLSILPITVEYAECQAGLPPHHKDPFDRFMIAQALVDAMPIVSADPVFDSYGITRIWA